VDRILTTEDLADRYHLSPETIKDWRRKGTGPRSFHAGKHARYRESDVLEWETAQVEKQAASA
jgi:predicted DNA-binding transcriptional regulator AlpA